MNKTPIVLLVLVLSIVFNQLKAQTLPNTITIQVPRGDDGGLVTMELEKYDVRDPNHCKLYVDEQSYNSAAAPEGADPANFNEITLNQSNYPVRTYRGIVLEEPNSQVVAVVWPGNNTMSAFVNEGIRYLWGINDLPITLDLNNGNASFTVSESQAYNYSSIDSKSQDWVPTFGNAPYPTPSSGSGPVVNGDSPYGWSLIPSSGFKKLQIAYDVEPEWFNDSGKANGSLKKMFAILEFATNALDLQFARDLGMQFRLTGIVLREDTDLHSSGGDVKTTWKSQGLADNPGASNIKPLSIPVQQIVYTQVGEGNPNAFQSRTPLDGGNYTKVPVRLDENSGLQHEVSHNWGGAHFVYPRDIMSGGGSWFGPTTNQRHIYIRDDNGISGNLPIASNAAYGWNVHPYATPDLANTNIGQPVTIDILKNDFDSNGDPVRISTFDATSQHGGSVEMDNGTLVYTPAPGFKGRDSFNYIISDGTLFNTSWVQVDVNNGGLLLRYDFETGGSNLTDVSGSNFNATSENFVGSTTTGIAGNAWSFPQLPDANSDTDDSRAFASFGDVVDPFGKGHTASIWFNADNYTINNSKNCHIVSNSSTAINKLISGYNIFIDGSTNKITFQISEQLTENSSAYDGTVVEIIGPTIQSNTWYHIALVVDRETNKMIAYVNANAVGNATLNNGGMIKGKPEGDRYTSGALGICTYKPKKYSPFVGKMDEFRIYGRALTPDEIQELNTDPGGLLNNPIAAPNSLSALAGDTSITLDWSDNFEINFDTYNLYRSTTSNTGHVLIASNLTESTYIDNAVTVGTTYYYVVRSLDTENNETENSNEAFATPGSTIVYPSDDIYVRSMAPDTNYAERTYLRVRGATDNLVESYLKFDVTGINGSIDECKLKLYAKDDIDNVTVHLGSDNSWLESTMIWNNKPLYGTADSTLNDLSANHWYEFDVTNLVQSNNTYTFVLTSTSTISQLDFGSKEDVNAPPHLQITSLGTLSTTNFEENLFNVYPTLTDGEITISNATSGTVSLKSIKIYNLLNQELYEKTNLSIPNTTLDVSKLSQGMYVLKGYDGNKEILSVKFVKK